MLEAMVQILPRHKPEIAAEMQKALEDEGISFRTGVTIENVRVEDDQKVVTIRSSKGARRRHSFNTEAKKR